MTISPQAMKRNQAMTRKIATMLLLLGFTAVPLAPSWAQAPAAKAPASAAAQQRTFSSAEAASKALADAVRAGDANALLAIVGPSSKSWLFSGDTVSDREDWKRFLAAYDVKNGLSRNGDKTAVIVVGDDDWPFPAPVVNKDGKWVFDAAAGREEVLNRRIGRNELDTIQTLLAIVDAQRVYAASDPDNSGFTEYASYFISSPGKKDGLYWQAAAGEQESPIGPLVGAAALKGYALKQQSVKLTPYNGYYFRMLDRQGPNAQGGAYDYRVNGRMFGGFAVLAYPASYGVSGVKTFMVNHDGVVFEKDLGPSTGGAVGAINAFDPDKTWHKLPSQ
jgi:hypothetical protein